MEGDFELVRLGRAVVDAEAALEHARAKNPADREYTDRLTKSVKQKRLALAKYTDSHPNAITF